VEALAAVGGQLHVVREGRGGEGRDGQGGRGEEPHRGGCQRAGG